MRKFKYHLIVFILFGSCSLFKNTTKTTSENSEKTNQQIDFSKDEKSYLAKNGLTISYNKDTILSDYTIQFWPKGDLSLSPSGVFTGKFDSVLVKGKVFRGNNSSKITYIDVKKSINKKNKIQSVNSTISEAKNEVKTRSVDLRWILILIPIILVIFFLWLNRFK